MTTPPPPCGTAALPIPPEPRKALLTGSVLADNRGKLQSRHARRALLVKIFSRPHGKVVHIRGIIYVRASHFVLRRPGRRVAFRISRRFGDGGRRGSRHCRSASRTRPRQPHPLGRGERRQAEATNCSLKILIPGAPPVSRRFFAKAIRPGLSRAPRREQIQYLAQALADVLDFGGRLRGEWNRGLPFFGFRLGSQLLPRPPNREALFVEQLLDSQDAFHIPPAVHPLPGAAFHRLQLRELALPEAQHVGGQAAQGSHFPDAEIQLVRDENFIRLTFILARTFFSRTHARIGASRFQYCDTPEARIRTISATPNRLVEAAFRAPKRKRLSRGASPERLVKISALAKYRLADG